MPFGGGIDSIVTVDDIARGCPDTALFVLHPPHERFAAIEDAAAVTGLPVNRVAREIDPQVRRSAELGFLNGHVPVTAIVTAAALVEAVLDGRDAVVLSNEWSASAATVVTGGRAVNHQWSKSEGFEVAFAAVVRDALGPVPSVFSYLRPRTELWVARRFAALTRFHSSFRSCNRAFHQDPARRLDHWCGTCDKCCFIDLVLAPFMDAAALGAIFAGHEPLENEENAERFATLLDLGDGARALRVRRGRRRVPRRTGAGVRAPGSRLHEPAACPAGPRRRRPRHRPRGTARPAREPPHPGSLCAVRSPGPRSLTRPSASGAWASRDAPASAVCARPEGNPYWSTTHPGHPSSTGSRCSRRTGAASNA